jgi:hypothetical protein
LAHPNGLTKDGLCTNGATATLIIREVAEVFWCDAIISACLQRQRLSWPQVATGRCCRRVPSSCHQQQQQQHGRAHFPRHLAGRHSSKACFFLALLGFGLHIYGRIVYMFDYVTLILVAKREAFATG